MSKIDINKVAEILKKNQLEPAVLRRIIEEINLAAQPDPVGDSDGIPPPKKQYVILVSDPKRLVPDGIELVGWVLQIPAEDSVTTVHSRVLKAAYEFNASKKGRLFPVKTFGEAIDDVSYRFLKDAALWVKTKEPVFVLLTDNVIPIEPTPKDEPNHSQDPG